MNNAKLRSIDVEVFLSRSFVYSIDNPGVRIKDEKSSIVRLINRVDYLSRYNLAIRYVFLWFLNSGVDISQNLVHPCFKLFLEKQLGLHFNVAKGIVDSRNRLKYSGIKPNPERYNILNDCINILESINR